jgi:hypothetical protein
LFYTHSLIFISSRAILDYEIFKVLSVTQQGVRGAFCI